MTDRIALVTGANKGLGLEVARRLGVGGHKVLLGTRDVRLGEEAAAGLRAHGLDAVRVAFASTDVRGHRTLAAEIAQTFGRLDILVNNAGISGGWEGQSPSVVESALLREVIDVNYLGVVSATQALLPLLRSSDAARVVNVSSGLGSLAQNADPRYAFAGFNTLAYNASKAALNLFTIALAKELAGTTAKVNAADPGWCRTDLGTARAPRSVEQGAEVIVRLATLPADGPSGGFFDDRGSVPW